MRRSDAKERIAELAERAPGAAELAELSSLAVRVEASLLRALRVGLLPQADVGAEWDLYGSSLVEARSPAGLVFHPAVADVLRTRLAERSAAPGAPRPSALARAWSVVEVLHAGLPEVLRLEERLVYRSLTHGPGDAEVQDILRRLLATLARGTGPAGLATWALATVERLPEGVRRVDEAVQLALAAAAQAGAPAPLPSGTVFSSLPPELPAGALREVAVRRHGGTVELEVVGIGSDERAALARGRILAQGPAPVVELSAPLSAQEPAERAARQVVTVPAEGTVRVKVRGAAFTLHTTDGGEYLVERAGRERRSTRARWIASDTYLAEAIVRVEAPVADARVTPLGFRVGRGYLYAQDRRPRRERHPLRFEDLGGRELGPAGDAGTRGLYHLLKVGEAPALALGGTCTIGQRWTTLGQPRASSEARSEQEPRGPRPSFVRIRGSVIGVEEHQLLLTADELADDLLLAGAPVISDGVVIGIIRGYSPGADALPSMYSPLPTPLPGGGVLVLADRTETLVGQLRQGLPPEEGAVHAPTVYTPSALAAQSTYALWLGAAEPDPPLARGLVLGHRTALLVPGPGYGAPAAESGLPLGPAQLPARALASDPRGFVVDVPFADLPAAPLLGAPPRHIPRAELHLCFAALPHAKAMGLEPDTGAEAAEPSRYLGDRVEGISIVRPLDLERVGQQWIARLATEEPGLEHCRGALLGVDGRVFAVVRGVEPPSILLLTMADEALGMADEAYDRAAGVAGDAVVELVRGDAVPQRGVWVGSSWFVMLATAKLGEARIDREVHHLRDGRRIRLRIAERFPLPLRAAGGIGGALVRRLGAWLAGRASDQLAPLEDWALVLARAEGDWPGGQVASHLRLGGLQHGEEVEILHPDGRERSLVLEAGPDPVLEDTGRLPHVEGTPYGRASDLGLPVVGRDRTLGAFTLGRVDGRWLTVGLREVREWLAAFDRRMAEPAQKVARPRRFGEGPAGHRRTLTAQPWSRSSTAEAGVELLLSPEPGAPPLRGEVVFHLPPGSHHPLRRVRAQGGRARLRLDRYLPGVVGVEADGGQTRLELELEPTLVPGVEADGGQARRQLELEPTLVEGTGQAAPLRGSTD